MTNPQQGFYDGFEDGKAGKVCRYYQTDNRWFEVDHKRNRIFAIIPDDYVLKYSEGYGLGIQDVSE